MHAGKFLRKKEIDSYKKEKKTFQYIKGLKPFPQLHK